MATRDIRGVIVDATDSPVVGDPNPGLAIKVACLCATTGNNITLAGLQTIDDVALTDSARVLVKDQDDPTDNGIYSASSGPWSRAKDADGNTELGNGLQVLVITGTLNGSYKTYVLTTPDPVVIGTSDIIWQAEAFPSSAIEFQIDGGGLPIEAGYKGVLEVPFDCRITRWTLVTDIAGSIVLDVRKTTFANWPADPADSIVGTDPPQLAAQFAAHDETLTGWTVQLRKGDLLAFLAVGVGTARTAGLSLLVTRN